MTDSTPSTSTPSTSPSAATPHVLVDLTANLSDIQRDLPPGVKALLLLSGNRVLVMYEVRTMSRGKRVTLGRFGTKEGAIAAMFNYKCHGVIVRVASEQQARTAQVVVTKPQDSSLLSIMEDVARDAHASQANRTPDDLAPSSAANSARSGVHSGLSMSELDAIVVDAGLPGYLFTAEVPIEATLASGGVLVITPTMQREYNEWLVAQHVAVSPEAAASSEPQAQPDKHHA